jgi:cbb3-type cytochrome oxidase maturation protein
MDDNTLMLMLFGSLMLGAMGVTAFIWGLRSGQFDDEKKYMQGLLYDGEEELREAVEKERRIEEAKKKASEDKADEAKALESAQKLS